MVGWYGELYGDSVELDGILDTLAALPAASIDHPGLSKAGFATLFKC